jgi:hypothetical protein
MNLSYNVRKLGVTDLGPIRRAVDILSQADYVFVCSAYDGIHVVNVANPKKPRVIGSWGWWEEGWFALRMKIVGERAYVVGHAMGVPPGLRILDISRPTHPTEVGYCVGDGIASWEPFHWDIAIVGTRAYVVFGGNLLWVVDISNPAAPVEVCDILLAARTSAVEIRENLAYVVAGGLQVLDIRDPVDPLAIGYCDTTKLPASVAPGSFPGEDPMCRQMAVVGSRAYVTDEQGGFRIVDISDPTAPAKIGWLQTPDNVRDVDLAVNGDFAFLLDLGSRGHLRVLDIRDPAAPVATGFRDIPAPCHCLTAAGDHVYVAGFTHFGIYDCSAALRKSM